MRKEEPRKSERNARPSFTVPGMTRQLPQGKVEAFITHLVWEYLVTNSLSRQL